MSILIACDDRKSIDIFAIRGALPRPYLFDALQSKYSLKPEESYLALDILEAFFLESEKNRTRLIVLPQVADWAWHEFILSSRSYFSFTRQIYGGDLPHMQIVQDDNAYEASKTLFHKNHNFDLTDQIWSESGWGSPAYRFSTRWRRNISRIEKTFSHEKHHINQNNADLKIDLSWLSQRVKERFLVNKNTADLSVTLYKRFLKSQRRGFSIDIKHVPSIALWAWQEHMLWTEKYKNDCMSLFRRYLHRPPIPACQLFNIYVD